MKRLLLPVLVPLLACTAPPPVHPIAGSAHATVAPALAEGGLPTSVVDFNSADAWLACRRSAAATEATCEQASEGTPGGALARAAADSFGPGRPPSPWLQPEPVAALIEAMRSWPDVASSVASYLPAPVTGTIRIFVVANGDSRGDAYVRTALVEGARSRLADDGEPVVILNALSIASEYPGTPREQATDVLGVVRHESFHVLFRWYRRADPAWKSLPARLTPEQELLMIALDEGIAHYIDRQSTLRAEGFPAERGLTAVTRFEEGARRLTQLAPDSPEARELLRAANQGRYWEKFGSIAGMLFAYGIDKAFGLDALRESVRCGPGRFLALYAEAVGRVEGLRPISSELVERAGVMDLCR